MLVRKYNLSALSAFVNPVSFFLHSFLNERDRWFLWLPVLMGAGITLYFALGAEPPLFLIGATPLIGLILIVARKHRTLFLGLSALLVFVAGFNAAQIETWRVTKPALKTALQPVSITGTLMRAEALPQGARLTLKYPSIKDMPREERPFQLRIKVKTPYADLPPAGSRVNVWGPLWPPNDAAFPGGYDFRRHAFFKQLGGTGLSYVEPRVYEARYPPRFFWDGFLLSFEQLRRALNLAVFQTLPEPQQAMTATLLSGSQTGIDTTTMEAMRTSGLSHLLSISGVHVSMMALLVFVPLRFLLALIPWIALRYPIKKIAACAAIIATALYTVLVGADAPTVRSALMIGIVFFAMMIDRQALSLRLVALAAMIIMLMTPSAMMGASFQMSFAAVLAMVAAYETRLDTALKNGSGVDIPAWLRRALFHMRDIVITSLIATAATTPFTIFHFQTFSFYGVIANMIAIPLTTLWIMPCLLLTYITLPFDMADLFIQGAGLGVAGLIQLAHVVAAWPYAKIPFPPMPVYVITALIGGGLWLCLWKKRWRYLGLIPIGLACLYPLTVTLPSVYVSNDKPVWAVRLRDGRMAIYGKHSEDFTVGQWLQHSMEPPALYLNKQTMQDLPEELSCDESFCAYDPPTLDGKPTIVFLHRDASPDIIEKVCANKALFVVVFSRLPDCHAGTLIDAKALEQLGAHSLSVQKGKLTIRSVYDGQTSRPWGHIP